MRGALQQEVEKGVLDVETKRFSGIDHFEPGYIDRGNEVIVGLQTDAPLKRIMNPLRRHALCQAALQQYGYALDEEMENPSRNTAKRKMRACLTYTRRVCAQRAVCGACDGPAGRIWPRGASLAITAAWR